MNLNISYVFSNRPVIINGVKYILSSKYNTHGGNRYESVSQAGGLLLTRMVVIWLDVCDVTTLPSFLGSEHCVVKGSE